MEAFNARVSTSRNVWISEVTEPLTPSQLPSMLEALPVSLDESQLCTAVISAMMTIRSSLLVKELPLDGIRDLFDAVGVEPNGGLTLLKVLRIVLGKWWKRQNYS
eukprot:1975937-Amphidinium_carterae.1